MRSFLLLKNLRKREALYELLCVNVFFYQDTQKRFSADSSFYPKEMSFWSPQLGYLKNFFNTPAGFLGSLEGSEGSKMLIFRLKNCFCSSSLYVSRSSLGIFKVMIPGFLFLRFLFNLLKNANIVTVMQKKASL